MSASYAEDIYVEPENTFPNLLADEGCPGRCLQVLNASKASKRIADNIADLKQLAAVWQPDIVLLYQMSLEINDLSAKYAGDYSSGDSPGLARHGIAPDWPGQMLESTAIYKLVRGQVTPRISLDRRMADELGPEADKDFEDRLIQVLDESASIGARLVLCTFATSHDERDRGHLPTAVQQFLVTYNLYLSPDGWLTMTERFNEIIRRLARDRHVPLADVSARVTGHAEYFRDFVHFNKQGHRAVAEVIGGALTTMTAMP